MSSMVRISLLTLLSMPCLTGSAPLAAQEAAQWDRARAGIVAAGPTQMAGVIDRWQQLTATGGFGFSDYSGFLLSYPGLPEQDKLRRFAEARLDKDSPDPARVVSFFDRYPPLTNAGRAQYALALAALGRPEALEAARAAWRGGSMKPDAEATLAAMFRRQFATADEDARMDALLWDRDVGAATRQFDYVSPGQRQLFMARLSAIQGSNPVALGIQIPPDARSDPGYVFNMVRQLRRGGQPGVAAAMLANRPRLSSLPRDPADWVEELLVTARSADARTAQRIAASIDDAFPPGADISAMPFGLRDDYTSLMWLGGTKALWDLGDAASAVGLFYRYGAAARTPGTRAKGFYWAGVASSRAGDSKGATRYFEMAARYPDVFYGQLSLERLGRPMPNLTELPKASPTQAERSAFHGRPIAAAVREAARGAPWTISVRFFREIAEQAQSASEYMLLHQMAQELGRRDLAVISAEAAQAKGHDNFEAVAFPTMPIPPGSDWTMVHAITRQESQFAQNALSHAGATGLMQLMPGTAREQAGKMGLSYDYSALTRDAGFNIRLGDGYFNRMLSYYGGSYPLAVAAYNAGPGNVNKWLRANGDPRKGGIDWIRWIEQIPIYETKNYVQRVLQNAAVYEHIHPERTPYRSARTISRLLGKSTPG